MTDLFAEAAGRTLLIVERSSLARAGLHALLQSDRWRVETAAEIPASLPGRSRPAALILGHDALYREGFDALRRTCSRLHPVPVVVVLPVPNREQELYSLGAGAVAAVSWSSSQETLLSAVESAIAGAHLASAAHRLCAMSSHPRTGAPSPLKSTGSTRSP